MNASKNSFLWRMVFSCLVVSASVSEIQAGVVSFGSGANAFNMEFIRIGNPGNAADTTGKPNPAGSVSYTYEIGKFEVSENMIDKYNALNPTLQITKDTRGTNKPASSISWNEAARFINWLNTSTGGFAAYKFTTSGVNDNIVLWDSADSLDYDPLNPYRSKRANYVLPSFNEWYKAAFYNPLTTSYFDYPTSSDTAPTAVASGTNTNTAVYAQSYGQGPADVDQAGGLSPYGVMGLAGNVWEWEESSVDLANASGSSERAWRGGVWYSNVNNLSSSFRGKDSPSLKILSLGFRVASLSSSGGGQVPEPSTMVIFGLGALGIAYRARRNSKI